MSQVYFLKGAGTGGAPFLATGEVGVGEADLLASTANLKFDSTEFGLQSIVTVAGSSGYVTGQQATISMPDGTTNGAAFGTDIFFNISGAVGGAQAAGVHVNTDFTATSSVGVYTGIDVAPCATANGATIDFFEGMSVDFFTNEAAITTFYGYYHGGVSNGGGTITNQYGLYFENIDAGSANAYSIYTNAGKFHIGGLQAFANNAAAVGGGLVAGDLYYTDSGGDGIVKIVI